MDFSSGFNCTIPHKLIHKLSNLGLGSSVWTWILDFLGNRPQNVRMRGHTSSTLILNTGTLQGCVFSHPLYSLCTHDCSPIHLARTIIKFADYMTIVGLGLITNNDSAYTEKIQQLTEWHSDNNQGTDCGFLENWNGALCPLYARTFDITCQSTSHGALTSFIRWGRPPKSLYFLRKLKHAGFTLLSVNDGNLLTYCCMGQEGPAASGVGSEARHQDDTTPSPSYLHWPPTKESQLYHWRPNTLTLPVLPRVLLEEI